MTSLGRTASVCSTWNSIHEDESFWKAKCIQRWPSLSALDQPPVCSQKKTDQLVIENYTEYVFGIPLLQSKSIED
jgi:hypothetical protein